MFEKVTAAPADPILGLTDAFRKDPRTDKINLGVGIYKDEAGQTPVLRCVKKAEARLVQEQTTKNYLSIEGIEAYGQVVQQLLFGADAAIIADKRARTAQAPGGTGALRIAGEFIARQLDTNTIWISNPTWANHRAVFNAAGLEVKEYGYYNADAKVAFLHQLPTACHANIQIGDLLAQGLPDHGHVHGLGRYRLADHACVPSDRAETPSRGAGLYRSTRSEARGHLVWCRVLHEHAGQFPVAAIRSSGILPEIGGPSAYHSDSHLPWFPALHLAPALRTGSALDLAGHCDAVPLAEKEVRLC